MPGEFNQCRRGPVGKYRGGVEFSVVFDVCARAPVVDCHTCLRPTTLPGNGTAVATALGTVMCLRRCAMTVVMVVAWAAAAVPLAADQSSMLVGGVRDYVVEPGDSLKSIAARAGADVSALAADNGLSPQARLVTGFVIRIDNRHIVPPLGEAALVVNLPQRMLFHRQGEDLSAYPVSVGRASWPTPRAPFTVVSKEKNPTWDVPQSILAESRRLGRVQPPSVPPGPANPLGAYWIGLSLSGIGIHGTNAPSSIYGAVSHGCMRLHPDDIAALFERVAVGIPGMTIYEPVLLADVGGRIYLEVHRDIYRLLPGRVQDVVRERVEAAGLATRVDWVAIESVIAARHGIARDVTRPVNAGIPPPPGISADAANYSHP